MTDCGCGEVDEGKQLSDEDIQRIRELLDPQTKAGRVCLRMLDHGETIGQACNAEGIGSREVMAQWHRLTNQNGIRSLDGKQPCISVLADAWERRWQAQDGPMWMPADLSFTDGATLPSGLFIK